MVYNLENIEEVENKNIHFMINPQLFLETLLMEIRGKTISYASYKKKEKGKKEEELKREILMLEKRVDNGSMQILEDKKSELEQLRKEKLRGRVIRSRMQWIEEGEKPSSYFCGLESRNFTSKIIPKIEKENGEIVTNQYEILNEVKCFYEKLYQNRDEVHEGCKFNDIKKGLKGSNHKKLSLEESDELEGHISLEEAGKVLKNMKNNKSPGSDGFSTEFFKFFWIDLGIFVVDSLNYGYEKRELSITQKQGIITCLPKGNKPRHFLKNWRPISLLNTVYKIGSGVIAARFKKVLDKLINSDQTGFIRGRFIGENLRLIYDILQYTEENDIPGLLLLIDFEKAFDSVSWEFLFGVLKFFNFGESIINWVRVLYTNINSAIIQGGNLSTFFNIGRGCRQGDPLSPYLFILCAEILSIRIRNNEKINGISITEVEHKLSQFADDTSLILDGKEESLNEALSELDWFANISGLNINFSKTQVIWIGSEKYSETRLCPNRNLSWGKNSFDLLGVHFDVDLDKILDLNYEEKIQNIKNIIKQWSKRNLTVIGRITVVKTLILPVLNYLILTLPNPSNIIVKTINDLIYSFIWGSPIYRVKKDVLQQSHEHGGLNMINLQAFIYALKCTWIRRILQKECKWQNIFMSYVNRKYFYTCGTEYLKELKLSIKNKFWKDVLDAWCIVIEREQTDNADWNYFLSSPIWKNKQFEIGNASVLYKDWFHNGILYVNDIVSENGDFYTLDELHEKFSINRDVMKYNSIISALKKRARHFTNDYIKICGPLVPSVLMVFLKSPKGTKDMYCILNKNDSIPSVCTKWNVILDVDEHDMKNVFKMPFIVTKNTKLQWLQYRINHRIIATNKFLHMIKKVDNPNCSFCNNEIETIEHLFWNCEFVQILLEQLDDWFLTNGISIPFTKQNMLLGNTEKIFRGDSQNSIFLWVKQYIYNTRYFKKDLSLHSVKEKLKYFYFLEKRIAVKNKSIPNFSKIWNSYDAMFSS